RAEQREELTICDVEVEVVDGDDVVESFRDRAHRHGRSHRRHISDPIAVGSHAEAPSSSVHTSDVSTWATEPLNVRPHTSARTGIRSPWIRLHPSDLDPLSVDQAPNAESPAHRGAGLSPGRWDQLPDQACWILISMSTPAG